MSEKIFEQISNEFVNTNSVTSLATRPNQPSSYGTGGLNATQLKQRFDALPKKVIEKYNEMAKILSSTDALSYLKIPEGIRVPDSYDGTAVDQTLSNLLRHIVTKDGEIAATSPITYRKSTLFLVLSELYTTLTQKIGETNSAVTDEVDRIDRLLDSILDEGGGISVVSPITSNNESINDVLADLLGVISDEVKRSTSEDEAMSEELQKTNQTLDEAYKYAVDLSRDITKNLENAVSELRESQEWGDTILSDRIDGVSETLDRAVRDEAVRAMGVEEALSSKLTEVEHVAKGAEKAKSYDDLKTMVDALNILSSDAFSNNDNINIVAMDVPDFWIVRVTENSAPYHYTSDEDLVQDITTNGTIHVGYYELARRETGKIVMTNYVEAYVGDKKTVTNPLGGTDRVSYSYNSGLSFCAAYLSSTITPTREQMIGAAYVRADRNISGSDVTGIIEIGDINEEESNDKGLCITLDSTTGLSIFVVYSTDYHPSFFDEAAYFPKPGIYLTEAEFYGDAPYIVSVDVWIIPRKQIDNRLINLKEHPDFIIPEPDLTDYVKNTDYAGEGKAGVIKTSNANGGCTVLGDGTLYFFGIQDGEWVARGNSYQGNRHLRLSHVDDIVKYGLTDNKKTLTDEEKASAAKWLGIPQRHNDLLYAPFGGHEEISINFSNKDESLFVNGYQTYRQTKKFYSPEELVDAYVGYYYEQRYYGYITSDMIKHHDKKGYTISVALSYIYGVYDTDYLNANFPSPGMYFSYLDDGDYYYVNYVYKQGTPIRYLDNMYLDLANNNVIQGLLARIEALENK